MSAFFIWLPSSMLENVGVSICFYQKCISSLYLFSNSWFIVAINPYQRYSDMRFYLFYTIRYLYSTVLLYLKKKRGSYTVSILDIGEITLCNCITYPILDISSIWKFASFRIGCSAKRLYMLCIKENSVRTLFFYITLIKVIQIIEKILFIIKKCSVITIWQGVSCLKDDIYGLYWADDKNWLLVLGNYILFTYIVLWCPRFIVGSRRLIYVICFCCPKCHKRHKSIHFLCVFFHSDTRTSDAFYLIRKASEACPETFIPYFQGIHNRLSRFTVFLD